MAYPRLFTLKITSEQIAPTNGMSKGFAFKVGDIVYAEDSNASEVVRIERMPFSDLSLFSPHYVTLKSGAEYFFYFKELRPATPAEAVEFILNGN